MENIPQIPEDDAGRRQFSQTHIDAWRGTELSQRECARRNSLPIARFTYLHIPAQGEHSFRRNVNTHSGST